MRYAAFLRAINVGAANRIKMADLKEAATLAGWRDVSTYLQSGNVLFEWDGAEEEAALALDAELARRGLKGVAVMVRSAPELRAVVAACPFDRYDAARYRQLVTFLATPVEGAAALLDGAAVEVVAARPREIITVSPLESRGLDVNAVITRAVNVQATSRYWGVVRAVLGLLDQDTGNPSA